MKEPGRAGGVSPLIWRIRGLTPPARLALYLALLALPGCSGPPPDGRPVVRVGSKKFVESEILGDMLAQLAGAAGARAEHLKQLGDTSILWNGLLKGDLDAYCEYTGTLTQDLLAGEGVTDATLPEALARRGLRMSRPLGFNNSYALAMTRARAAELGVRTISDLRAHPGLRFGLSNPFLKRDKDGWEPLRRAYDLPQQVPAGLEHDLALRGVRDGAYDVTDIYATDAKVRRYDLFVLEDDRRFFPRYDAVVLYRADLADRAPAVVESFLRLEGRIRDADMVGLNARVDTDEGPVPAAVASADFLADQLSVRTAVTTDTLAQRLTATTLQHLRLVGVSLAAGILIAVPLGVLAARRRRVGQAVLAAVGVVQTVPALALLVLLLVLGTGYGAPTAIIALFLYSLLPIVRNTYTGLKDIPLQVRESAEALGLSPFARLYLVELPMASRSILAGIKTAAVICVGNATLGGLIAAGGYGTPIILGINRDSPRLILEGAIPAVLLALLVQLLFEEAERFLVPKGLRLQAPG
jgi:osmoprotectant transport system permease protein